MEILRGLEKKKCCWGWLATRGPVSNLGGKSQDNSSQYHLEKEGRTHFQGEEVAASQIEALAEGGKTGGLGGYKEGGPISLNHKKKAVVPAE